MNQLHFQKNQTTGEFMLHGLLNDSTTWPAVVVLLVLVFAIGLTVGQLVASFVRHAFVTMLDDANSTNSKSHLVRGPIQVIRITITLLTTAVILPPALQLVGIDLSVGLDSHVLAEWLLGPGLQILLIAVLAKVIIRLSRLGVQRFEQEISRRSGHDFAERAKRAKTLGNVIQNSIAVLVVGAAVLMTLKELGLDITPVLTGAGIIGLAVGFGAQTLVRDIISGFFIIFEDQVRVGDVTIINGTSGTVETIKLRTISLRDLAGTVHVFPNGTIETLSNMTKDFSYCVLDIGVAYREDTDEVVLILEGIANELRSDKTFQPHILAPLEVLGVDAFEDSQVTIKIRIKTVPIKQWEVGRELRRRIKKTFDAKGIEIPFPHRSVLLTETNKK